MRNENWVEKSRNYAGPATVAHVADFYRRYPGELVTFYTNVEVRETAPDLTLRITLPDGLTLHNYSPPPEFQGAPPYVEVDAGTQYLVWSLAASTGARYEYQTQARIAPVTRDKEITSRAVVTRGDEILSEESATFLVRAKGDYLRYLPEIYADDDLMGRFLMLFESFWSPIETQIDSVSNYFNPEMTPPDFLRWLASWFDLTLNERLPEERRRQLVQAAVPLYRQRGTKQGLKRYLEIYTGGEVHIVEHRADNFRLGSAAALGPGIALGRNNRPHTFTVRLRLPPEDDEATWLNSIRALIEAEKPAHTAYTLYVESTFHNL